MFVLTHQQKRLCKINISQAGPARVSKAAQENILLAGPQSRADLGTARLQAAGSVHPAERYPLTELLGLNTMQTPYLTFVYN